MVMKDAGAPSALSLDSSLLAWASPAASVTPSVPLVSPVYSAPSPAANPPLVLGAALVDGSDRAADEALLAQQTMKIFQLPQTNLVIWEVRAMGYSMEDIVHCVRTYGCRKKEELVQKCVQRRASKVCACVFCQVL